MLTREIEISEVQRDYMREKNAAKKEFEEKKEELKINLLMEAEEKKKIIEQERYSLDLNGDSQEVITLALYLFHYFNYLGF